MKRATLITLDRVHRRLGASLAALFAVVAFTGTVSVFRHELDTWGNPGVRRSAPVLEYDLDAVVETALGGREITVLDRVVLLFPDSPTESFHAFLAPGIASSNDELFIGGAPASALGPRANAAADTLFELHAYLLTGSKFGRYLIGALGLAFVVSTISGFFAYRHRGRDAFRMRWDRGLRGTSADAHKALGLWALLFHLVIGLTGAYLGLKDLFLVPPAATLFRANMEMAREALAPPPPRRTGHAATMLPVSDIVERARTAIPGFAPNTLILDAWGDEAARATVRGNVPGHLLAKREAFKVEIDGASGAVVTRESALTSPPWTRLFHAIAPLHYGNAGGSALKWLYFVLGASTVALTLTGLCIRASRRSPSQRRATES